jgi:REP element-mobilizing transposase RayT
MHFKQHNVSGLLDQIAYSVKYRSAVMSETVAKMFTAVVLEIAKRWWKCFLQIGSDRDHAYFLTQSVLMHSPTRILQTVKNIRAREVFAKVPEVKKKRGGEFRR